MLFRIILSGLSEPMWAFQVLLHSPWKTQIKIASKMKKTLSSDDKWCETILSRFLSPATIATIVPVQIGDVHLPIIFIVGSINFGCQTKQERTINRWAFKTKCACEQFHSRHRNMWLEHVQLAISSCCSDAQFDFIINYMITVPKCVHKFNVQLARSPPYTATDALIHSRFSLWKNKWRFIGLARFACEIRFVDCWRALAAMLSLLLVLVPWIARNRFRHWSASNSATTWV